MFPNFREMADEWGYITKLLKPTGRWRLTSGPHFKDRLSVEHQGYIFKRWVWEEDIFFSNAKTDNVFECAKGGGDDR